VRRISVVGVSGSGKSRLARELAGILDVSYIELDAIVQQADWVPLPDAEFRATAETATAADGWVVDGNCSEIMKDSRCRLACQTARGVVHADREPSRIRSGWALPLPHRL
jgi:adenylate kinase family enzyme